MITETEAREVLDIFPTADLSIIEKVIYFDGWSDYEECGGCLIFEGIDGSIQYVDYGYCVMATDNTNYFEPEEITKEEMGIRIDSISTRRVD